MKAKDVRTLESVLLEYGMSVVSAYQHPNNKQVLVQKQTKRLVPTIKKQSKKI